MNIAVDPLDQLTAREHDVLALMAQGSTDFGISKRLFVTQKTVEFHARNIFRKLDVPAGEEVNRRVHAVLTFLRGTT
jgi:DNA-binding NarL/FixJ family response regulator